MDKNTWTNLSFYPKVNTIRWSSWNKGKVPLHFEIVGINKNEDKITILLQNRDRNA